MQNTMRFKNMYELAEYLIYCFVTRTSYDLTIGTQANSTLSLVMVGSNYIVNFRGVQTTYTSFVKAVIAFKLLFYDWRYQFTMKGFYLSLSSANVSIIPNVISNHGVPDNSLGVDGSVYLDIDTLNVYEKISGSW